MLAKDVPIGATVKIINPKIEWDTRPSTPLLIFRGRIMIRVPREGPPNSLLGTIGGRVPFKFANSNDAANANKIGNWNAVLDYGWPLQNDSIVELADSAEQEPYIFP